MKTLKLLKALHMLYEQDDQPVEGDATEPSPESVEANGEEEADPEAEEPEEVQISNAERTLIKILIKAFVYIPGVKDDRIIKKLKKYINNEGNATPREIINYIRDYLQIPQQFLTLTNEPEGKKTPLTVESEKYYSNLISRALIHEPSDRELKIINSFNQQFFESEPTSIAETIETLLDITTQSIESNLDDLL